MTGMELADSSSDQRIKLETTPVEQIPLHIAANARCRTCGKIPTTVTLEGMEDGDWCACQPEPDQLPTYGPTAEYQDKTLVICGAGPSLKQAYKQIKKADEVWGCNRAANWLCDHNWRCTHAVGIDAGPAMFEDAWADPPDVEREFILATSVDPRLTDHLLSHGKKVRFFHSMRGGFEEEIAYYQLMWRVDVPMVGRGLNVVNRALELADWLKFKTIYLAGADNALGPKDAMYADGNPLDVVDGTVIVEGRIKGRTWRTKIDMLMSARDLAERKWEMGSRLRFIGNTLPAAIARCDPAILDRIVKWAPPLEGEKTISPKPLL